MPAEWAPHASTWIAWPSHAELWQDHLTDARAAFVELATAIAEGETLEILVPDEPSERLARAALPASRVRYHRVPFGDIWLRDTAPLFLVSADGRGATVRFGFNGWGGKYVLDHDADVAACIEARLAALAPPAFDSYVMPFVLEGGAVEVDGEGTVLTTRQCLQNANRNPSMDAADLEQALRGALGAERVLWFEKGLLNDHTDGHIDTIARFVRPGVLVVMDPRAADDPNRDVLVAIGRAASKHVDARGRKLEVVRVPSPGRVTDREGRVLAASFVNFYIANAAVIVPTYGSPYDDEAVEKIGALFPGRRAIGVDARAVLTGGGAFHCITQQQPALAPVKGAR